MSRQALEVAPFAAGDLEAAAELLAARQRRLRQLRPELPAAYERPEAHLPSLSALMATDGAHAVVARLGGQPAGFMAGFPRLEPIWGRAAWSPMEGSALADGVDPEVIRDLYAAWSQRFVTRGFFRQYAHVAADDDALAAAWFRTGFGAMQAYAARDLVLEAPSLGSASRSVRRARTTSTAWSRSSRSSPTSWSGRLPTRSPSRSATPPTARTGSSTSVTPPTGTGSSRRAAGRWRSSPSTSPTPRRWSPTAPGSWARP